MKKTTLSLLILFLFVVAACAPTQSSRYREGSNVGQVTHLTVQDEERLTKEAMPQMLKDYPPANNQELQKYISYLGMKIVRANNLEGNPYRYDFKVVDVAQINAFALPAGKVFITMPLIAMATTEAELAGVVAHEIGHVVARHAAERMYVMEQENKKTWLYAGGGAILGGAIGLGLGALLCEKGDTQCLATAAALGGVAGAGGGILVQKYKFLVNSREDEMEADRIGFRLAVNAGYDKNEVGKFYEKLLAAEQQGGGTTNPLTRSLSDAFSTHPPSQERVQQMRDLAAQSPAKKGVVNTTEFNRNRQLAASLAKKL